MEAKFVPFVTFHSAEARQRRGLRILRIDFALASEQIASV